MPCRSWREVRAGVDGRGIDSDRDIRRGRRESIVAGSGGGTRGERMVEVRFWRRRVWWVRWVVRAAWAVINLRRKSQ